LLSFSFQKIIKESKREMQITLIRTPRESEMSLSTQVKASVDEAQSHLREALAFAARSEHPIVINTLSDLIAKLDSLEAMEKVMQKFNPQNQNNESLEW
jgi:DNA repair photolyase